MMVLWD